MPPMNQCARATTRVAIGSTAPRSINEAECIQCKVVQITLESSSVRSTHTHPFMYDSTRKVLVGLAYEMSCDDVEGSSSAAVISFCRCRNCNTSSISSADTHAHTHQHPSISSAERAHAHTHTHTYQPHIPSPSCVLLLSEVSLYLLDQHSIDWIDW